MKRDFATPKAPLIADQLPRFIMACAWPLGTGGKSGVPVVGYGERDDSRTTIERDGTLQ